MLRFALLGVLASAAVVKAVPVYQSPMVYQAVQPSYQTVQSGYQSVQPGYQTVQSGYQTVQPGYQGGLVVPIRAEIKPEDISGGVSGWLHGVSPAAAGVWVRGQKWKWNHIHTALQAAGLPGGWAPYPPTWDESRFGALPVGAVPVVVSGGIHGGPIQVVPIGSVVTGPAYVINKKK